MMELQQLIKRIDRASYQPDNEAHFAYDPDKNEFKRGRPWFGWNWQFYEVTCSPMATPNAVGSEGPVGVQEREGGNLLRIHIGYQAWVLKENAEDLVRSVAGDNPGERLRTLVIAAVRERIDREPISVIDDSAGRTMTVGRELERQLLEQHGLSVLLSLRLEDQLPTVQPLDLPQIALEFPIQVRDYPNELKLSLRMMVGVEVRHHARAKDAMERRPHLDPTIKRTCREFFVGVGLQQLRERLHDTVKDALQERLEKDLATWFLQLRKLTLELPPLPGPLDFLEVETSSQIKISKHARVVGVHTRVQLQLQDEARYWRAGGPPLDKWVHANVPPILQRILFDVHYSQLCLKFGQWEAQILQELKAAAATIGYTVRAQITTPTVTEQVFLNAFLLQVSEDFATAIDIVTSRLEIVLRLRLRKLDSIVDLLDRGVDPQKEFKQTVIEEVAAYLHGVQPAFLFTRFTDPADPTGRPLPADNRDVDDRPPVDRALFARLQTELGKRYGLEVVAFQAKQGPSKIRDCYLNLTQTSRHPFDVLVHLRGHALPVVYHMSLRVIGVDQDGWHSFQRILPSPADVASFAADSMRTLLEQTATLAAGVPEAKVDELAQRALPAHLNQLLGISTVLATSHRERSVTDDALAQARLQVQTNDLQAEINRRSQDIAELAALEKTLRMYKRTGQDEEAARIEGIIGPLRASLASASSGPPLLSLGAGGPEPARLAANPGEAGATTASSGERPEPPKATDSN